MDNQYNITTRNSQSNSVGDVANSERGLQEDTLRKYVSSLLDPFANPKTVIPDYILNPVYLKVITTNYEFAALPDGIVANGNYLVIFFPQTNDTAQMHIYANAQGLNNAFPGQPTGPRLVKYLVVNSDEELSLNYLISRHCNSGLCLTPSTFTLGNVTYSGTMINCIMHLMPNLTDPLFDLRSIGTYAVSPSAAMSCPIAQGSVFKTSPVFGREFTSANDSASLNGKTITSLLSVIFNNPMDSNLNLRMTRADPGFPIGGTIQLGATILFLACTAAENITGAAVGWIPDNLEGRVRFDLKVMLPYDPANVGLVVGWIDFNPLTGYATQQQFAFNCTVDNNLGVLWDVTCAAEMVFKYPLNYIGLVAFNPAPSTALISDAFMRVECYDFLSMNNRLPVFASALMGISGEQKIFMTAKSCYECIPSASLSQQINANGIVVSPMLNDLILSMIANLFGGLDPLQPCRRLMPATMHMDFCSRGVYDYIVTQILELSRNLPQSYAGGRITKALGTIGRGVLPFAAQVASNVLTNYTGRASGGEVNDNYASRGFPSGDFTPTHQDGRPLRGPSYRAANVFNNQEQTDHWNSSIDGRRRDVYDEGQASGQIRLSSDYSEIEVGDVAYEIVEPIQMKKKPRIDYPENVFGTIRRQPSFDLENEEYHTRPLFTDPKQKLGVPRAESKAILTPVMAKVIDDLSTSPSVLEFIEGHLFNRVTKKPISFHAKNFAALLVGHYYKISDKTLSIYLDVPLITFDNMRQSIIRKHLIETYQSFIKAMETFYQTGHAADKPVSFAEYLQQAVQFKKDQVTYPPTYSTRKAKKIDKPHSTSSTSVNTQYQRTKERNEEEFPFTQFNQLNMNSSSSSSSSHPKHDNKEGYSAGDLGKPSRSKPVFSLEEEEASTTTSATNEVSPTGKQSVVTYASLNGVVSPIGITPDMKNDVFAYCSGFLTGKPKHTMINVKAFPVVGAQSGNYLGKIFNTPVPIMGDENNSLFKEAEGAKTIDAVFDYKPSQTLMKVKKRVTLKVINWGSGEFPDKEYIQDLIWMYDGSTEEEYHLTVYCPILFSGGSFTLALVAAIMRIPGNFILSGVCAQDWTLMGHYFNVLGELNVKLQFVNEVLKQSLIVGLDLQLETLAETSYNKTYLLKSYLVPTTLGDKVNVFCRTIPEMINAMMRLTASVETQKKRSALGRMSNEEVEKLGYDTRTDQFGGRVLNKRPEPKTPKFSGKKFEDIGGLRDIAGEWKWETGQEWWDVDQIMELMDEFYEVDDTSRFDYISFTYDERAAFKIYALFDMLEVVGTGVKPVDYESEKLASLLYNWYEIKQEGIMDANDYMNFLSRMQAFANSLGSRSSKAILAARKQEQNHLQNLERSRSPSVARKSLYAPGQIPVYKPEGFISRERSKPPPEPVRGRSLKFRTLETTPAEEQQLQQNLAAVTSSASNPRSSILSQLKKKEDIIPQPKITQPPGQTSQSSSSKQHEQQQEQKPKQQQQKKSGPGGTKRGVAFSSQEPPK